MPAGDHPLACSGCSVVRTITLQPGGCPSVAQHLLNYLWLPGEIALTDHSALQSRGAFSTLVLVASVPLLEVRGRVLHALHRPPHAAARPPHADARARVQGVLQGAQELALLLHTGTSALLTSGELGQLVTLFLSRPVRDETRSPHWCERVLLPDQN